MPLSNKLQYSHFLFDNTDKEFVNNLTAFITNNTDLQTLTTKYRIQHANDLLLLKKWRITYVTYSKSVILFKLINESDDTYYLVITKDSAMKYQYCCFVTIDNLNPVPPNIITKQLLATYDTFHIQGNIIVKIKYEISAKPLITNRSHIKLIIGRHQINIYTTTKFKYIENYITIPIPTTIEMKVIHPEHGELFLTTSLYPHYPYVINHEENNKYYYATLEFNSRNDRHYEDFYKQ